MKHSATLRLGKAFGIDVLLHWSFFLLPLIIVWLSMAQGESISVSAIWVVLLIIILASVLLHELGHGLAAKKLGIPILDIMLTPICGLARLERPPDTPRDEVLVSLAGPLANAVAAAILGVIALATGHSLVIDEQVIRSSLLLTTFWVNVSLCVLNLLPVFPMDGGRILRAAMAMKMEPKTATLAAARLGQFVALLAIGLGIVTKFYALCLIGAFLIWTAQGELR